MKPPVAVGVEARYEFCIGPSMRPSNDTPKRSARPKSARRARLVVERRREGGDQAAAALHVVADGGALRVRERRGVGRISNLNAVEPIRRRRPRAPSRTGCAPRERVVHADHVILGASPPPCPVDRRSARRGQRDARQRRLVAKVALVAVVPVVDALDHPQPAAIVEHAARTLVTRRKLKSKCGTRRSRRVATTASSVLPVASTNAVHSGAFVAALTAKAPSQIAGQSRGPQISRLAIAIPVGAQTVVTCSATNAARKPISAAAT